jgi:isoleucyl-tRNA synthetase
VFEFHPVTAKLQMYCSEDLGGFYLDILKDRLYTSGVDSPARRSAQTALWHITQALLRLMAPILSFTCEEAWQVFAGEEAFKASGETIFTGLYHVVPEVKDAPALLAKYALLREVRAEVMKRLEDVRVSGAIGSSLQAQVEIKAGGEAYKALASLDDDLKYLLITSEAKVSQAADGEQAVEVTPSPYVKCERCWHYRADVGHDSAHPGLCARCTSNLFGPGEKRRYA